MSDVVTDTARGVIAGLNGTLAELGECYVDLHRHPELSTQEVRTAGIVADRLPRSGYEVTTGVGGTGVVGVLRNGDGPIGGAPRRHGRPAGARADRPALRERGRGEGPEGRTCPVMHACGHDAHTTCLVGAADLLARDRDAWQGTLMWFAQPARRRSPVLG